MQSKGLCCCYINIYSMILIIKKNASSISRKVVRVERFCLVFTPWSSLIYAVHHIFSSIFKCKWEKCNTFSSEIKCENGNARVKYFYQWVRPKHANSIVKLTLCMYRSWCIGWWVGNLENKRQKHVNFRHFRTLEKEVVNINGIFLVK